MANQDWMTAKPVVVKGYFRIPASLCAGQASITPADNTPVTPATIPTAPNFDCDIEASSRRRRSDRRNKGSAPDQRPLTMSDSDFLFRTFRPLADTLMRIQRPLSTSNTRFDWMLAWLRLGDLMFEWDTLCPFKKLLPVTAQTAMGTLVSTSRRVTRDRYQARGALASPDKPGVCSPDALGSWCLAGDGG